MLTALDVARYLVALCDTEAGDNLSNLKLQKLLYYAQGVALALTGRPLFEESLEAWQHGPVVPSVYRHFQSYGAAAIVLDEEPDFDKFDEPTQQILAEVFEVYGQFSAWKLRNMTHEEPPWADTPLGAVISERKLTEFFKTRILQDDETQEEPESALSQRQ